MRYVSKVRRVCMILLAAAMVLGLCACGGKDLPESSKSESATEPTAGSTENSGTSAPPTDAFTADGFSVVRVEGLS